MSDGTLMWILGAMQFITLLLIGWVKLDIAEIWRRMNKHGHTIDCRERECAVKTTGVFLKEGGD